MNADLIDDYVAELTAALHGPARAKSRLVEEIRDGLAEAVAAHTGEDLPYQHAFQAAVREFGTPAELAPGCQQELTIAQTRHTARALIVTVGFLVTCWYLTWTAGHSQGWQLPPVVEILAAIATTAGTLAAAALFATGALTRWLSVPDRLPLVVGWMSTTASVAMPFAALAFATSMPLARAWPLIVLAVGLTVASHAMLASAARACRECARLPIAGTS
ncbi:permease prefix domain 1-containing protein [Saccharopolyspora pogona]|uniref:permease prefix domain 1-containing protein n=1 Tax=Saccharopolyspora pogona TaxID=333966 RepID=UPI001683D6CA|nr:permease prefix domain 1-containing protein [Saccharopolyspora pogona]